MFSTVGVPDTVLPNCVSSFIFNNPEISTLPKEASFPFFIIPTLEVIALLKSAKLYVFPYSLNNIFPFPETSNRMFLSGYEENIKSSPLIDFISLAYIFQDFLPGLNC